MPPNRTTTSRGGREGSSSMAGPSRTKSARTSTSGRQSAGSAQVINSDEDNDDVFAREEEQRARGQAAIEVDAEGEEELKTIPPELLTRLLHEFFEKDGTRISKDANSAVAKYMDIFVREAIARAAVEKETGFLEVDDLEKIAPQLLLDL